MILRLFKGIMNPKTFFAPALRLQDPPALLGLSRISAKIPEELGPVLHRPKAFLYFCKGKACAAQIVQDIRLCAVQSHFCCRTGISLPSPAQILQELGPYSCRKFTTLISTMSSLVCFQSHDSVPEWESRFPLCPS